MLNKIIYRINVIKQLKAYAFGIKRYFLILKRNEDANMDLKKILLTKVAKVSEYTAEQGDGWPTYWGFHEIIPDSDIKTILAKKKNEKKNDK